MDAVASAKKTGTSQPKTLVHPSELINILDQYADQMKVLSLDCFDTLILRNTATPTDVFYNFQNRPTFSALNFNAQLRAKSEANARSNKFFHHNTTEVTLKDIYLASFPSLPDETIQALANEELACEHEACYAFPPTLELIRAAHARGIKIIIVSDTYLRKNELHALLSAKLPPDILEMIDGIFCSCEYGMSKSVGLFQFVIKQVNVKPNTIMHIGDNYFADFNAPKQFGMHSFQLQMQDKMINELLRMQAVTAAYFDPSYRTKRGLPSPFHGVFAAYKFAHDNPESAIGYAGLGPIMYAFSRYICDEIAKIKQAGKNLKVFFLMRDAHLSSLMCNAITGNKVGYDVRISRFAAQAASFRKRSDIDKYMMENIASHRYYDMCHQLLIPNDTIKKILKKIESAENSEIAFAREIYHANTLDIIYKNSQKYLERLLCYLKKETGLTRGDTIMFVDLGYSGTTQHVLQDILKEKMDIDIIGRYLIQLNIPNWQATRRGLLDPSWCDDRAIAILVNYIALLEQMCTSNDMSVIDYDEEGNPLFSESGISKIQYNKLQKIQDQAIEFAKNAEIFCKKSNVKLSETILRDAALIGLARLLFLPTKIELQSIQSFEFDLSLGTSDLIKVYDSEAGVAGLRKRGLFFMEKNLKTMRTNYPAELRYAGIELVLLLITQLRSSGDINADDFSHRRETVPIIVARGAQTTQISTQATPTFDGYFSLLLPIASSDVQLGIQLGQRYQWVQLDSAEIIKSAYLYTSHETENSADASPFLAVNNMLDHGGGLFESQSEGGMVIFTAPEKTLSKNNILRLIFRPIVKRDNSKNIC